MGNTALFVPNGISWEAQFDRGVVLTKQGLSVEIHEHSFSETCPGSDTPNGAVVRCGELHEVDGAVTLVPASATSEK
jgi:hypothetical protein